MTGFLIQTKNPYRTYARKQQVRGSWFLVVHTASGGFVVGAIVYGMGVVYDSLTSFLF
jgi:hypothetical protein